MNRATFLATLLGGSLALPRLRAAESPVENAIYDLLDEAIDAQFSLDFPRLLNCLHPASLHLFREILSARFDRLLRSYPLDQIAEVSGLSQHPKDLKLSDGEIFLLACETAKKQHPDFVGDEKLLPLNVHGTVFDHDRRAYVLFSYSKTVQTERTHFRFRGPQVYAVRREQDAWQVSTDLLGSSLSEYWCYDLAKPRKLISSGS